MTFHTPSDKTSQVRYSTAINPLKEVKYTMSDVRECPHCGSRAGGWPDSGECPGCGETS